MPSSREIRRKIKSIRSTRQITRAMELVSAAKMKKAVNSATSMRTYASMALMLLTQLSERVSHDAHPLLVKRPVKKILVLAFSSDRGLCGGFNTTLFKKLLEYERQLRRESGRLVEGVDGGSGAGEGKTIDGASDDLQIDYLAIGKRAQDFLARTGRRIVLAYPAMSNHPKLVDTLSLGKFVLSSYEDSSYDEIVLLYQHFFSPLLQKPTAYQLLPFSRKVLEETIANLNLFKNMKSEGCDGDKNADFDTPDYLFEPSPQAILGSLLPQLTQMQIYQATLETAASEHSARMLAMRNATNNASDFINDLTLHLNQVRQAAITREIAEISAGKIALEG